MSKNLYVDFVTDKHFLDCVKYVCDKYLADSTLSWNNGRDPFKLIFDMVNLNSTFADWENREVIRQADKSINNRIGEFHQKLLGGVKGWSDLGIGDDTKLDLKKNDDSIFFELKNKFNTVNSDSTKAVREKLEKNLKDYPNSKNYLAFLIAKNGSSGDKPWKYKARSTSSIRKIWGNNVYSLVTGQRNALQKTWESIPSAIHKILNKKFALSDDALLKQHFHDAFFLK